MALQKLRCLLGVKDDTDRARLYEIFSHFDAKKATEKQEERSITLEEFKKGFLTQDEVESAFKELDSSFFGDGNIFISEFCEALRPTLTDKRKQFLKAYFSHLTKEAGKAEGDMELSLEDMKRMAKSGPGPSVPPPPGMDFIFEAMIKRCEAAGNKDGKINLKEFVANHVADSQKEFNNDEKFATLVINSWGPKFEFNWASEEVNNACKQS